MSGKRIGLISGLTYGAISLAAAGLFLGITAFSDYNWVARGGGAAWIFILTLIISMPLVTSRYKKRYQSRV
jgi:hypothetical protein